MFFKQTKKAQWWLNIVFTEGASLFNVRLVKIKRMDTSEDGAYLLGLLHVCKSVMLCVLNVCVPICIWLKYQAILGLCPQNHSTLAKIKQRSFVILFTALYNYNVHWPRRFTVIVKLNTEIKQSSNSQKRKKEKKKIIIQKQERVNDLKIERVGTDLMCSGKLSKDWDRLPQTLYHP